MGARDLPLALILARAPRAALLALGVSVPVSAPVSATAQDARDVQLLEAYVQRRLALEAAWSEAPPEARERARAVLAPRDGEDPFTPSAPRATRALRLLHGDDGRSSDPRAEGLADSIDLRLLPPAFEACERARGEPLVARVRGLWPVTGVGEVELALVWVAPDGKELRAAVEHAHPAALAAGFELYFNAPRARPGTWRLVPEITTEAGSARGLTLVVECVPPSAGGASPAGPAHDPSTASPVAPVRAGGGEGLGLELLPAPTEPVGVVLIVPPSLEELEWTFAGPRAAAWRAVIERGWRVIATREPLRAAAASSGERAVVIRAADLALLDGEAPELERLVMITRAGAHRSARARELLWLELDAELGGVRGVGDGETVVALEEPAPLAYRAAPRWIARWLAGVLSAPERDR